MPEGTWSQIKTAEVNFLGWLVSAEGYRLDPSRVDPVLNLKKATPKMVGDVCKLIGLLRYYRLHIQDFSRIAKSVYDLLFLKPSTTLISNGAGHGKLFRNSKILL